MENKRKETRTAIHYNAHYTGFTEETGSGRIIPCVIHDISRHGMKISSAEPASNDNVAVFFVNQEKKHLIVTGEVVYCTYMHDVTPLVSYVFNIGIRFLKTDNQITEFITTLVRFSSKMKAEKSFSAKLSLQASDRLNQKDDFRPEQEDPKDAAWGMEDDLEISSGDLDFEGFVNEETDFQNHFLADSAQDTQVEDPLMDRMIKKDDIRLEQEDSKDTVWGTEDDLKISFNDLDFEEYGNEGTDFYTDSSQNSQIENPPMDRVVKKESDTAESDDKENKRPEKFKKVKHFKSDGTLSHIKMMIALCLIFAIVFLLLIVNPFDFKAEVPLLNRLSLTIPDIRKYVYPSSDSTTGDTVEIDKVTLSHIINKNVRGEELFIIKGNLLHVAHGNTIKVAGIIYDNQNKIILETDSVAGISISDSQLMNDSISEIQEILTDPFKRQRTIQNHRVSFLIVFPMPDIEISNYTVKLH